jgi:hypothetical protein
VNREEERVATDSPVETTPRSNSISELICMKQQAIERWENEGGEIPNAGADA